MVNATCQTIGFVNPEAKSGIVNCPKKSETLSGTGTFTNKLWSIENTSWLVSPIVTWYKIPTNTATNDPGNNLKKFDFFHKILSQTIKINKEIAVIIMAPGVIKSKLKLLKLNVSVYPNANGICFKKIEIPIAHNIPLITEDGK